MGWREDAGEPSGVFHSGLRARFDRGEPAVVEAMAELGDVARAGPRPCAPATTSRLAALVDRTFDLRAGIATSTSATSAWSSWPAPHGASANYAGSGGAITGTLPHPDAFDDLRARPGRRRLPGAAPNACDPALKGV